VEDPLHPGICQSESTETGTAAMRRRYPERTILKSRSNLGKRKDNIKRQVKPEENTKVVDHNEEQRTKRDLGGKVGVAFYRTKDFRGGLRGGGGGERDSYVSKDFGKRFDDGWTNRNPPSFLGPGWEGERGKGGKTMVKGTKAKVSIK